MTGPQDALSAALERWNADDLDGYLRLYDEGIRLHGYSPEPMGKEQVRSFYQGIFGAFGAPKLAFDEVLWDGDACAIRLIRPDLHIRHPQPAAAPPTAPDRWSIDPVIAGSMEHRSGRDHDRHGASGPHGVHEARASQTVLA